MAHGMVADGITSLDGLYCYFPIFHYSVANKKEYSRNFSGFQPIHKQWSRRSGTVINGQISCFPVYQMNNNAKSRFYLSANTIWGSSSKTACQPHVFSTKFRVTAQTVSGLADFHRVHDDMGVQIG